MTSRTTRRSISLALIPIWLLAVAPVRAEDAAPAGADAMAQGIWPRQLEVNGNTVLVYQPQVEKWDGNKLEARAAVSVQAPGAQAPVFGVIWISARTEVDKTQGIVSLEDVTIPKVNFPTAAGKSDAYLEAARKYAPEGVRTVSLEQLEANVAVTGAKKTAAAQPVVNDPPKIIVSTTSAILVRIDGQPSMRQLPGSSLMRVINTRALIVLDPATTKYYLTARDRWWQASAVEGPWAASTETPAAVEETKRSAKADEVDLLTGESKGGEPTIYVSTVPADLIETKGPPTWSPITGTQLLYATNTDAHLFIALQTQTTYVLISGRWFSSTSIDGPWVYVPAKKLPADFAQIPENEPPGKVLASVAGTPQAAEAVIANSIPQTASVKRSEAHFTPTYDGAPQWKPVTGTSLTYAVNSPAPIIRVTPTSYYALYNGVWFMGPAPTGPWVVAATVPAVIYTIPVSSPIHYVTYVRVYSATPEVVYVGYTPGYLGTVVTPEGVVVYGTGVAYTPWVGTVWYPPPPTYGYGAGFAWGATTGFVMGAAWGSSAWGCCGNTYNVNVNKTTYNYNGNNVYNGWSKTTVSSGNKSATMYSSPNSKVVTNNQNNNVYASHDGNVYKKQDGSWSKWDGSGNGWQPVNTNNSNKNGSSKNSTTNPSANKTGSSAPGSSNQNLGSSQSGRRNQQPGGEQGGRYGQGRNSGEQGLGSSQRGMGQGGGRFGGASGGGGLFGGLDRESMGRDRGFDRFSGSRGGGGGFRR